MFQNHTRWHPCSLSVDRTNEDSVRAGFACFPLKVKWNRSTKVTVFFIVSVPPSVVQHSTNATRTVGETVRFLCSFSGIPKPTVAWFHVVGNTQTPVSGSSNHVLSDGQLEIRQVTKGSEGRYLCEATNIAGKASSSAFLKVQGEGRWT